MKKKETRVLSNPEFRFKEEDGNTLFGYAARFDSEAVLTHPVHGEFTERISPGAFGNVLNADVRALLNHDPNFVFGRTKSGTLRLSEDDNGLKTENNLPETQAAKDLKISVERGDITQQSFGFVVGKDEWSEDPETKKVTRNIKEIEKLFNISYVTYPAYPDTEVALRSLDEWRKKEEPPEEPDPMVEEPEKPIKPDPMVDEIARNRRKRELSLKHKQLIIEQE